LKIENKDAPVDGFADIIVFSVGAIIKMGYEPKCVLAETLKEINSRTGKIIDGKFIKDTSEEAKKRWYKADHSKCIMKGK
jgi:predicted HAD superfamily Cof-like phosphohydrolase